MDNTNKCKVSGCNGRLTEKVECGDGTFRRCNKWMCWTLHNLDGTSTTCIHGKRMHMFPDGNVEYMSIQT